MNPIPLEQTTLFTQTVVRAWNRLFRLRAIATQRDGSGGIKVPWVALWLGYMALLLLTYKLAPRLAYGIGGAVLLGSILYAMFGGH